MRRTSAIPAVGTNSKAVPARARARRELFLFLIRDLPGRRSLVMPAMLRIRARPYRHPRADGRTVLNRTRLGQGWPGNVEDGPRIRRRSAALVGSVDARPRGQRQARGWKLRRRRRGVEAAEREAGCGCATGACPAHKAVAAGDRASHHRPQYTDRHETEKQPCETIATHRVFIARSRAEPPNSCVVTNTSWHSLTMGTSGSAQ